MTDKTPALPPVLESLLDRATSEAKRRGHGVVTPAHLVVALTQANPELAREAFADTLLRSVDAALDRHQRTFETPQPDADALGLMVGAAQSQDSLAALVLALQTGIGTAEEAEPTAVAPTPEAPEAAAPDPGTVELRGAAIVEQIAAFGELVEGVAPLAPRSSIVGRIAALLNARTPQTPLVVAPQGAGRTTLAQCLAAGIAPLPESAALHGMPVIRLRPESLISSGDASRGLSVALRATAGKAVLFIDDVDVLAWLSVTGAGFSALRVLRSALHSPDIRVVLTIEQASLDQLRESDLEFFEELELIRLEPLEGEDLMGVAQEQAELLAEHHGVAIPAEVISAAVAPPKQSDTVSHPGLAVLRMDRAASSAALRSDSVASAVDLGTAEGQQYVSFDADAAKARLSTVVFGQDEAIDRVTRRLCVTRAALDLRPERPDGVFLLAGPTGTGKTHFAINLAAEVFGSKAALIRIDMSELVEPESVTKLIGPPPGYVGSKDPESWLTTKVRRRPQSVLLLDEIEKAHPIIWNTFLQVFDAGRLTDSQGRAADFRDVIVVMTTNIGSESFAERNDIGFAESAGDSQRADAKVREELKLRMRPELLNRMDEIVIFRPLDAATIADVARLRLADAIARLASRGWIVDVDPSVLELLIEKGYSREYGARPMLRAIEELLLAGMASRTPGRYRITRSKDIAMVEPA